MKLLLIRIVASFFALYSCSAFCNTHTFTAYKNQNDQLILMAGDLHGGSDNIQKDAVSVINNHGEMYFFFDKIISPFCQAKHKLSVMHEGRWTFSHGQEGLYGDIRRKGVYNCDVVEGYSSRLEKGESDGKWGIRSKPFSVTEIVSRETTWIFFDLLAYYRKLSNENNDYGNYISLESLDPRLNYAMKPPNESDPQALKELYSFMEASNNKDGAQGKFFNLMDDLVGFRYGRDSLQFQVLQKLKTTTDEDAEYILKGIYKGKTIPGCSTELSNQWQQNAINNPSSKSEIIKEIQNYFKKPLHGSELVDPWILSRSLYLLSGEPDRNILILAGDFHINRVSAAYKELGLEKLFSIELREDATPEERNQFLESIVNHLQPYLAFDK